MKINRSIKLVALAGATPIGGFAYGSDGPATGTKVPKPGIWRGEFTISETKIPFN